MKVAEAKRQFIQDWGILAGAWGISRTIGQVHALLLVSRQPLNSDEIMKAIAISRGNCHGAVKELLSWGIIHKTTVLGNRKEYYKAEKDIWRVAQLIAQQRKRQELDPVKASLQKFAKLEGPKEEIKEFQQLISDIHAISDIAGKALDLLTRSGFVGFLKIFG